MLINLSNHPSDNWGREQTAASIAMFGHTEDMPFPDVSPTAEPEEIQEIAQFYVEECFLMFGDFDECCPNDEHEHAVHVQGEFTLVYALVNMFRDEGIRCYASTSERNVVEEEDGKKTLIFNFVQFREYY